MTGGPWPPEGWAHEHDGEWHAHAGGSEPHDWHYGDASMGEVPLAAHHGADSWPPVSPAGEGCER